MLILTYYHFQTLIKFHCQLFLFRIKMVDQCDKPINLGNFVFDEENHEPNHGNCLDVHVIDLF